MRIHYPVVKRSDIRSLEDDARCRRPRRGMDLPRLWFLRLESPLRCGIHLLLLTVLAVTPIAGKAAQDAVILMYHHISEDTPPSTSVTPEMFSRHMKFLDENDYNVWPLFQTLMHLASGKPVPEKTVVLTFDDGYASVYTEAYPLLKARGWPFTVFVTTQYIGDGHSNFMSWEQLREITRHGGEIGNHSTSHAHLVRKRKDESDTEWRERVATEILSAQKQLRRHIRMPLWAVAYPYGEFSKEVRDLLWELGFFGLGQQSGAVGVQSDFQSIPRYPMATGFDDLENFEIKVSSKALPVEILSPEDGILPGDAGIPELKMRLLDGEYNKGTVACYASGQGRVQTEWIDRERGVLSVKANEPLPPGRSKYNCTARSSTGNTFHWYSWLWMKPNEDGSWYSE